MNDIYVGQLVSSDYLEHHGILGMKWGVRRFQREDGSLTSAGKKRNLVNEHKNEGEKKPSALKRALASNAAGKLKSGIKESAARAYDSSVLGKYKQQNVAYWDRKNAIERGIDNIKAAKRRKTLSGKMSELVGAGAKKRYYQNEANVQRALANKAYKSSKNKAEAERNARNSEQQAKYFDSVNKGKTKDTLRGRFNIPYEKANGKTTTRGKQYISDVGKRVAKKAAVEVGKRALQAAIVYGAGRAASRMSNQNYRVLEVQTLEDKRRRLTG